MLYFLVVFTPAFRWHLARMILLLSAFVFLGFVALSSIHWITPDPLYGLSMILSTVGCFVLGMCRKQQRTMLPTATLQKGLLYAGIDILFLILLVVASYMLTGWYDVDMQRLVVAFAMSTVLYAMGATL